MRRAVFLDRDGVLNEPIVRDGRAYAPLDVRDFRVVSGAAGAIARLRAAGLLAIVVTNQPEVARGTLAPVALLAMHTRLRKNVAVDDVWTCPHEPTDGCDCRKPRPGLLVGAARKWDVDLGESFLIGDRWHDIEAGRAVGCYTVLLERPYSACTTADARAENLETAVAAVLTRAGEP
jgi:D-glycero-D-manno-heptose 1,7-bisphosphate phosphatase